MLTDDLLKVRYAEHLDKLIELAEKEIERTKPEPHYQRLAHMYHDRFRSLRHTWRCHEGDLVRAFRGLQEAGRVEVITSTATHAFFPLMDRNWANIRAQVHVAADLYERHFGYRPRGMWLGECGYVPGVDELLREAAIRYFFVDTHGILFADQPPAYGVYAPLYCPSGVAAFGRDIESSEQVWSAKEGYPGDKHYRDFYRDIGFDLPMDYIKPYIHPEGHRVYTGIKYHAITHNQLHDKWVYDPDIARGKAGLHASHFRGNREKQVQRLRGAHGPPADHRQPVRRRALRPLVVRGADLPRRPLPPAALRPGRRSRRSRRATTSIATPPTRWRRRARRRGAPRATTSTGSTRPTPGPTATCTSPAERMVELARRHPSADPLTTRALNQAARELMLAQSSDWTFIMKTGTTVPYATRRINQHILQFNKIYDDLQAAPRSTSLARRRRGAEQHFPATSTTASTPAEVRLRRRASCQRRLSRFCSSRPSARPSRRPAASPTSRARCPRRCARWASTCAW